MVKFSNDNVIVRDARPEEADKIGRLLKASFLEYKKDIPPEGWKYYLKDLKDVHSRMGDADLIVAEVNGRLAGTVTLYLNSDGKYWPEGWAVIRLLGVRPAYRGYGIGQALLDECIRRCRHSAARTIGLYTTDFMAIAKHMYEKMGFKRMPEQDFRPRPDAYIVMAYRMDL